MILTQRNISFAIAIGAALPAIGLAARAAHAATINVGTYNWVVDSPDGKCSLPGAVAAVNDQRAEHNCSAPNGHSDTIQLQPDTDQGKGVSDNNTAYVVASGLPLTISKSVTIVGALPSGHIRAQGGLSRILGGNLTSSDGYLFYVNDSAGKISVNFTNINFVGPNNPGTSAVTGIWSFGAGNGSTITVGGSVLYYWTWSAIVADGINLVVNYSEIQYNSSPANGGGILFSNQNGFAGGLTILDSTIARNTAVTYAGGIDYEGQSTSSITGSTIAYNTAPEAGGLGLFPYGATVAVNECTIAGNYCGTVGCYGGGMESYSYGGTSTITASIVANNVDVPNPPNNGDDWDSDALVTETNSIISKGIRGISAVNGGGNKNGTFPLGTYAANPDDVLSIQGGVPHSTGDGSRLPVYMLPPTSNAIDFLSSLSLSTDERGFPRGVQVNNSSKYDIGAVEYDPHQQIETMQPVAVVVGGKSTQMVQINDSSYSNGVGEELPATGKGDYVQYYDPYILASASYTFNAQFATGPSAGQMSITATDSGGGSWTLGTEDLYAKSSGFKTVTFTASGGAGFGPMDPDYFNYLTFTVTGKNSASKGYAVYLDYITPKVK